MAGGFNDEEKLDWLQLTRTSRVGPVTFFQLLSRFGSAASALQALPSLPKRKSALQIPSRASVEAELQATRNYGADILCAQEPEFPKLLSQLAPPPPVLTVLGKVTLASNPCVAVVGARQASAAGRKLARDISKGLSEAGFVIVSGLARGIDGEAHAAALDGGTVAVLGGGIDHIYPSQHDRLYAAIAANGAVISESPFGYRATARDFPRRNRIVTGICAGVVVIEAAERSGSLISARTALEQNREVMAIPGSPLEPRAAGNNRLLRQGATLVRDAADIIEALSSPGLAAMMAPEAPGFDYEFENDADLPDSQIQAVRQVLGPTPVSIDEVARASKIGARRCAAIVVELELSGEATTHPGGFVSIAV